MRGKHIKIELSASTRNELEKFTKTGKHSVRLVNRAKIILELDETDRRKPLKQAQIAEKIGVARQTVNDAKRAFITADNIPTFLQRKKRETPPIEPKITGEVEAHIIALAFPPEEAFRLAQRLEIHYTPKHGSWLNIAEIELSALAAQCLGNSRISSIEVLNKELFAWKSRRNADQNGVDWHFTTADARFKLKRLYPVVL